jgi:hypothetical protein
MRRRASEGGQQQPQLGPDGQPLPPGMAGVAPVPGAQQYPGQQPYPGQQYQNPSQSAQPGQPGIPITGQPGMTVPGQPGTQQSGVPGQMPPGMPGFPGAPGQGMPGRPQIPGTQQYPSSGQTAASQYQGGVAAAYGSVQGTAPGQTPGQRYPGMPGPPVNSQTGGMSPYSTVPGAQGAATGFPQPGMQVGGQPNDAVKLIQQILTSPRPGGMPAATGAMGMSLGAGIAGVASTSEDEGILVYNERTKYNEWEFIYDPTKEKRVANPAGGVVGTPASQIGNQPGSPGFGGQSGLGGQSGFGGQGSFGGQGGFGGQQNPQPRLGRP